MAKELSKLQIRAEVMMILQKLHPLDDDMPRIERDKCIAQLKSIKNQDDVIEILIKELPRAELKKSRIISFLLMELASLNQVKDSLWAYIKNPDSSDELKDIVTIILKSLGDESNPEVFLSYLDDPKTIIDKETKRLLEIAIVNPEAQIDFLDFLLSLPEEEQVSLIDSLKSDYSGECLANILITLLESNPSINLQENVIKALGESKTSMAVPALNKIANFSNQESIKKLAKKSLNLLKLSGIDINKTGTCLRGSHICKISKIYKCYANHLDGTGSQGLIVSRVKENQDIIMFSVVLNDQEGIIDCFGFNGISKSDFARVINRFKDESNRVSVSPEYCKYMMEKAEQINNIKNTPVQYEYIAWKSLMYDFPDLENNVESVALKWAEQRLVDRGDVLYQHEEFKYWFLDENDNPAVKSFLDKIISESAQKHDSLVENPENLIKWLDNEIISVIPEIFDKKQREIYTQRLVNTAYLFDIQGLTVFRNIASSVAMTLRSDEYSQIKNSQFLIEFMRKTICEGFLRYQAQFQQNVSKKINPWSAKNNEISIGIQEEKLLPKNLDIIANIIYNKWLEK